MREPHESLPAAPPPLLILLHGIGSNEEDLFGLAPYLDERFLIVSVRAPVVMGAGSYGWFNLEFTPQGMRADIEQAKRSLELLPVFLDEIVNTHRADDKCVYVAGFSQGAMMSLALALTRPDKINGVVAMSGRFPAPVLERDLDQKALEDMPVLVTHGMYDPVLPVEEGRGIQKNLQALRVQLTYREYPMGHEVTLESLRDVSTWLSSKLDEHCAT